MKKLILIVTLCLVACLMAIKDLGAPNWSCDEKVMAKSKKVPTNVNSVRFADIKVIGALGDSLTAANGAGSKQGDPLAVILQYRGLAFQIGGDKSLDEHITVANVLRKFNPNLVGYSVGIGSENVWDVAHLNMGVPGAESVDIVSQARALVSTMRSHPDKINIKEDWKLVNIFIGANDICVYCEDPYFNSTAPHGSTTFEQNIIAAVKILQDNLPRTIISLTGMFNMRMLRKIDHDRYFCEGLHLFECDCESNKKFSDDDIQSVCFGYMNGEKNVQDSGMFEKDDFTFVVQPFFNGIVDPPYASPGVVDMTFFAPDCFHFSAYGHSNIGMHLWNTIIQPVEMKQTSVNLSDPSVGVRCPNTDCPFFPTTKNSKDCASFYTPSVLDL